MKIKKIILKFTNIQDKQYQHILDDITNQVYDMECEIGTWSVMNMEQKLKVELFKHEGGVNNKMIPIKIEKKYV